MTFPAFLDTCTLFGGALNDVLLTLAERGLFRPLWSHGVLQELERNLARRVPADKAHRRVVQMREAFPDAETVGYEHLIDRMQCDDGDRHVLAAAVRSNAAVLVTFNLKHFPSDALVPYDLEAVHPDNFLLDQLDLHEEDTLEAIMFLVSAYEMPPLTMSDFLEVLRRSHVPQFADAVALRL